MPKKLKKNRCWQKLRESLGPGFIEVREHKPNQTFVASLAIGLGLLFGCIIILSLGKPSHFESIFAATVLTVLPIAWVLVVYRVPRGLRLYPEQQVLQRYETLYGIRFFSRWIHLKDRKLLVSPMTIYSMEASDGKTKTAITLTGLFAAMGIIGTLPSLGVSNDLQEKRATAYAITVAGDKRLVAFFLSRQDALSVLEKYAMARNNKLEGYQPGPNQFEKPLGV